jgi:UDPglucose 6-dehydrogenase
MAFYNPSIRVTVVDKDEGRIRRWNSSHPPIYEPGLREILRVARDGFRQISINWPTSTEASGTASDVSTTSSECESQGADHRAAMSSVPARQPNLVFSTQVVLAISEADIILIAVNTPTKSRGSGAYSATDMTAFEAVTTEVAQHARPGAIIVEKSTVPCRTSKMVQDTVSMTITQRRALASASPRLT